jgi:hypothetical protein
MSPSYRVRGSLYCYSFVHPDLKRAKGELRECFEKGIGKLGRCILSRKFTQQT